MATKVKLSANEISDKWNRRTKASVSDIQAGIDRVSENPAQKAISKKEKMKANLVAAIDNGTWARRLGEVSLEDWKSKTRAKVAERLAGGVDGAMNKRGKFDAWLVSTLNGVLPDIEKMPDMTLEDSVNRVRKLMEHMSKNAYKRSSG